MKGYIPTARDVDLEKGFIIESVAYGRKPHMKIATDILDSSGGKKSSSVLVPGGEKMGGMKWITQTLLLFKINVSKRNESQEYSYQ